MAKNVIKYSCIDNDLNVLLIHKLVYKMIGRPGTKKRHLEDIPLGHTYPTTAMGL